MIAAEPTFLNEKYISRILKGSPQLSKSKTNLYPETMNINSYNINKKLNNEVRSILEILNLSDGSNTLFEIAYKRNISLKNIYSSAKRLIRAKYIKKI